MAIFSITNSSDLFNKFKLTHLDSFTYSFNKEGICSALFSFFTGRIIAIKEVKCFIEDHQNSNIGKKLSILLKKRKVRMRVNTSTRIIQRYTRKFLNRKGVLSNPSIRQYKKLCEDKYTKDMRQAIFGESDVYFPKSHPEIVLKREREVIDSNKQDNTRGRFNKMKKIRVALDRLKCFHLILPKAIIYDQYLIEERLPINPIVYQNMRNYILEPELFDEAVREMVRLSSSFYFSDIIDMKCINLCHIPGFPDSIRYDNFPLYFVTEHGKKQGRIGLVDIESASTSKDARGLTDLVRMFPYHLNIIREEADRLFKSGDKDLQKTMDYDINDLEHVVKRGMEYLSVGYCNHSKFLKEKKVSTDVNTLWSFDVNEERLKQIKKVIKTECLLLHEEGRDHTFFLPTKDFLTGDAVQSAKMLSDFITPIMISKLKELLKKYVDKYSNNIDFRNLEEGDLIFLRSATVGEHGFYSDIEEVFTNSSFVKKGLFNFARKATNVVRPLAQLMIDELIKGREILSFHRVVLMDNTTLCWLRY